MDHRFRHGSWFVVCLLALAFAFAGLPGCSPTDPVTPAGDETLQDVEPLLTMANPAVISVMTVQNRHTPDLMSNPNVIGTATTIGDDGRPAIMILVLNEATRAAMPGMIEGVGVKVVVTDRIVALGRPGGGGGTDHKAKQTPPIKLGTSGGWKYDLANNYCCGGTLGSLVQVGNQKRILSNYHVFEADIVSGGNNRVAQTGDPIIQPGLIDVNCNAANAQDVATLVKSSSLPNSNVDASTATIISGMVDDSGAILQIGTLSSSIVSASINQAVKKSGRTTGLTRSKVSGLNATVSVSYENECAGGTAFTKTFTGQILVENKGSKFLAGGDSGSLMVEDVTTNPRAVGLLFAGSNTIGVANPIGEVLAFFNASMVGN